MSFLIAMTESEFERYIKDKEARYAMTLEEHTFEVTELPVLRAKKAIQGYLPNGFQTLNHEFFNIIENEKVIGYVWLKIDEDKSSAFLYEIYLLEAYRSKGIGKRVIIEIEEILSIRKIRFFKLHVFGTNEHAIHLYNLLGFKTAGINMYKEI